MPYSPEDAKRFTKKASSPKAQRQWAAVYESARKAGKSEGKAITMASGVIKKSAGKTPRKTSGSK